MSTWSKWPRCVGALGAFLFLSGITWFGLWSYSHRDYPEAIKYELRLPWPLRLMVFFGLALLVVVGVQMGTSFARRLLSKPPQDLT
jgi:hypothetical protein